MGCAAATAVAAILLIALFIRHISHPRIITSAVAPDGTEFCVVQKCNWDFELFNTSCYYRKPGGPWGWLYFDHQDNYWDTGRAVIDETARQIVVYRGNEIAATFDWQTETYHLLWKDRVISGAQEIKPVGWAVTQD